MRFPISPLPGNLPKRKEYNFRIIWKDDTVEVHKGFTLADALEKAKYGEGAMKDIDLWYKIPEPVPGFGQEMYGILVRRDSKHDWEEGSEKMDDRDCVESLALGYVKRMGYAAAMVFEASTGRSVYLALP
jgi:hypothetical protein